MTEQTKYRPTIPEDAIWTLDDLASYMNMNPSELQQKLTDKGVRVFSAGKNYRRKLIRLRDIFETKKSERETYD